MYSSEREVADVLDKLHVDWEYEPTLFIFETDEDGHPKKGFKPDFYLVKFDLYLEVTKAKVLTDKHRKLRNAWELYNVKVELINRHHFDELYTHVVSILQSVKNNDWTPPSAIETALERSYPVDPLDPVPV